MPVADICDIRSPERLCLIQVIAGPSGVGKGTLIDRLLKAFPGRFGFSVSHTTRAPRPGEVDGVHYNFVSKKIMVEEIAAGKFIEHAEVHTNFYGTSVSAVTNVQNKGEICILDIDVQGVKTVKQSSLSPVYLFIAPPSMPALEARLRGRGTETEEKILKRLGAAQAEMDYGLIPGNMDHVIVNDNLEIAETELITLVKGYFPVLQ